MPTVETISTAELDARPGGKDGLEFWNVLTDEYFSGEMIPGSRRVPFDRVAREAYRKKLARDAEVVVYSAGPKCQQGARAAGELEFLGFTNVRVYEGGIEEWKRLGRSLERVAEYVAA